MTSFTFKDHPENNYTITRNDSGGYDVSRYEPPTSRDAWGNDRDGSSNSGNYHAVDGSGSSYRGVSKERQDEVEFNNSLSRIQTQMKKAEVESNQAAENSKAASTALTQSQQEVHEKNRQIGEFLRNLSLNANRRY